MKALNVQTGPLLTVYALGLHSHSVVTQDCNLRNSLNIPLYNQYNIPRIPVPPKPKWQCAMSKNEVRLPSREKATLFVFLERFQS